MKFSIVTPSFNSERFITETIESVISQKGDFELEYIIIDGGSTDETVNIIKKYERQVRTDGRSIDFKWVSEKDGGMYDAINKGFEMATGDIYAWINADDMYMQGAFEVIAGVFKTYPDVKWVKGITSYMDEASTVYQKGLCFMYEQKWIQQGIYGREAYFIQQDSVFWRSDLWKSAGGIDPGLKMAGDYSLWIKFAQHAPLYTVKAYVSCFRRVTGQLSQDFKSYLKEYEKIPLPYSRNFLRRKIKIFFTYEPKIHAQFLKWLFYVVLFGKQNLFLITLTDNGRPVMSPQSYYVAS